MAPCDDRTLPRSALRPLTSPTARVTCRLRIEGDMGAIYQLTVGARWAYGYEAPSVRRTAPFSSSLSIGAATIVNQQEYDKSVANRAPFGWEGRISLKFCLC